MCAHLKNDVSLLQVSILGSQACTSHLFNEDLTPQTKTVLCETTKKKNRQNTTVTTEPFRKLWRILWFEFISFRSKSKR